MKFSIASRVEVCPECGWEFPEPFSPTALIPISNVGVCQNCGFLLSLAAHQTLSLDSSIVPRGLALKEQARTWTAVAHPDESAFGTWVFSFGWLVIITYSWYAAHSGLDFIGVWLTAFTPLWFVKAWGIYTLSCDGDEVTLFTGVGKLGYARQFSLKAPLQVRLRTQPTRGGERKLIIVHADRTLCFGEELSDDQRRYLAALLMRKGRAAKQA